MAIYRLEAKIIGRSRGHSATAAAAYRARARIVDSRTGTVHDFTRRSGVEHTEILTPAHAPAWMREDRARLWNLVEKSETRTNAQVARELVLTLPRELSAEQRIAVTRAFVSSELVSLGMVADVTHHTGRIDAAGLTQPHSHVLISLREIRESGFSRHKARAWNSVELLERWRAAWAAHLNEAMQQAGITCVPLDHRSLAEQRAEVVQQSTAARAADDEDLALELDLTHYGLDRAPEPKKGRALYLEDRNVASEHGRIADEIRAERIERVIRAKSFRVWLRKEQAKIVQAVQDLGTRLRAGLTDEVLGPLRSTNLAVAGGMFARNAADPDASEEHERAKLRQRAHRALRDLVRGRGRGSGR